MCVCVCCVYVQWGRLFFQATDQGTPSNTTMAGDSKGVCVCVCVCCVGVGVGVSACRMWFHTSSVNHHLLLVVCR